MVHAQPHHLIDGFGLPDAFHQAEYRLVYHRHKNAIGDEARIVVHLHRRLPEPKRDLGYVLRRLIRCRESADDLDELHHRHRIHEVHADDLVGTRRSPPDLSDRDGARVGGEHRRGFRDAIEIGEDAVLETAVFARGFDDERRALRRLNVHAEIDPREDLYLFFGGDRPFFYLSLDVLR